MKNLGIYIHIPFCFRKCNYCDFLSFGESSERQHETYFHALIKEINHYGNLYGNEFYVDSVFVGGGTPSLVNEALIADVMSAIRAHFNILENAEITIESNPKTLTKSKLISYLKAGINRLSMGVQSLDENLLQYMGRIHSPKDFIQNYYLARECGFTNMNVDLIFAVPGMSMDIWLDTLKRVIDLQPEHISFYSLQLEEGTPFFRDFEAGKLVEIDDELDRQMYWKSIHRLNEANYLHYEISNAAKSGFECKHNLKYWSLDDYLGIGLGSHSYIQGKRFSNITDFETYLKADEDWTEWIHENTLQDDISEYLITGMRKIEGIELKDFQNRFGKSLELLYEKEIDKFITEELLEIKEGNIRFTPRGIDISNKILSEFV